MNILINSEPLNNKLKLTFDEIKRHNPNMSLDEVLYAV